MVLAAYGYVEVRGSGSPSTSRPWRVTSSEWSGHGWTRCWSHRLPWRPLPPLHEATGAVASPLMPTRTGYGAPQRPHRPQHKPRPEQPNPSRLTALTPQNQPERPLLRGNQTYQDRGEASSPRPAAGVSASRGSSASGGISTSAGAYRRAPSSTRVASILGIIGCDEDSQGGAVRLDELKRVQTC